MDELGVLQDTIENIFELYYKAAEFAKFLVLMSEIWPFEVRLSS